MIASSHPFTGIESLKLNLIVSFLMIYVPVWIFEPRPVPIVKLLGLNNFNVTHPKGASLEAIKSAWLLLSEVQVISVKAKMIRVFSIIAVNV